LTDQQSLAESTAHIAWLMRSVVGAKPTLDKSMVRFCDWFQRTNIFDNDQQISANSCVS
jgi:hypothetical protein